MSIVKTALWKWKSQKERTKEQRKQLLKEFAIGTALPAAYGLTEDAWDANLDNYVSKNLQEQPSQLFNGPTRAINELGQELEFPGNYEVSQTLHEFAPHQVFTRANQGTSYNIPGADQPFIEKTKLHTFYSPENVPVDAPDYKRFGEVLQNGMNTAHINPHAPDYEVARGFMGVSNGSEYVTRSPMLARMLRHNSFTSAVPLASSFALGAVQPFIDEDEDKVKRNVYLAQAGLGAVKPVSSIAGDVLLDRHAKGLLGDLNIPLDTVGKNLSKKHLTKSIVGNAGLFGLSTAYPLYQAYKEHKEYKKSGR